MPLPSPLSFVNGRQTTGWNSGYSGAIQVCLVGKGVMARSSVSHGSLRDSSTSGLWTAAYKPRHRLGTGGGGWGGVYCPASRASSLGASGQSGCPLAWKSSISWDLLSGEDIGSVGPDGLNFKVLSPGENNEMGLRKTLILK